MEKAERKTLPRRRRTKNWSLAPMSRTERKTKNMDHLHRVRMLNSKRNSRKILTARLALEMATVTIRTDRSLVLTALLGLEWLAREVDCEARGRALRRARAKA